MRLVGPGPSVSPAQARTRGTLSAHEVPQAGIKIGLSVLQRERPQFWLGTHLRAIFAVVDPPGPPVQTQGSEKLISCRQCPAARRLQRGWEPLRRGLRLGGGAGLGPPGAGPAGLAPPRTGRDREVPPRRPGPQATPRAVTASFRPPGPRPGGRVPAQRAAAGEAGGSCPAHSAPFSSGT